MNSPPTVLRAAVLGCGRMGLETLPTVRRHLPNCWLPLSHAEAVASHPSLKLVGFCDPFSESRYRAKALYPDLPIYKEAAKLLHDERPDVVCIATRTPERADLIELCIDYGVRRLHLEKPLCTSVGELRTLSKILRESGTHCTFGAIRRYLAPYRQAQSLFREGCIGKLQEVHVAFGPGRLCWSQIHGIDLIAACLAPADITEVRATAAHSSYTGSGFLLDGDPLILMSQYSTEAGPQGLISTAGGCDLWLHGDRGLLAVLNDGQELLLRSPTSADNPYWTNQLSPRVYTDEHSGTASALDRLVKSEPALAVADTDAMLKSQTLLFATAQSILMGGLAVSPNNLEPDLVVTGRAGELFA